MKEKKLKKLEEQYSKATGYKKDQLISKINRFKNKLFPKVFWDSSKKGTYKKRGKQ